MFVCGAAAPELWIKRGNEKAGWQMEIDVTILGFSTAGRKQLVKRNTDRIYDGAHVSPVYMYIQ